MKLSIFFISIIFLTNIPNVSAGSKLPDEVDRTNQELFSLWIDAAEKGYLDVIKMLVTDVDINAMGRIHGYNALMWAVMEGHKDVVKFLLEQPNINVNLQNRDGVTALMIAVINHRKTISKMLLQLPATHEVDGSLPSIDVNIQENYGYTALMYACKYENSSIIEELLKRSDICLNIINNEGQNALSVRDKKDIRNLINQKVLEFKNTYKSIIFEQAIQTNNIELLKALIIKIDKSIVDMVDDEGNTTLHYAFIQNNMQLARLIFYYSSDLRNLLLEQNNKCQTPLELVNPTSPLFILCMDLAYAPKASKLINLLRGVEAKKVPDTSCANCSNADCTLRCSTCKDIYYCSEECQKADWQAHKAQCASPA